MINLDVPALLGSPGQPSGLVRSLGLPASFKQVGSTDAMAADMVASPFSRASLYKPSKAEYAAIMGELLA